MKRLAAFLLCLLWLRPALGAVAFDSKSTANCTAAAATVTCTSTKSPTIGSGSNRALVVSISYQASGAGPTWVVTWGGTPVPLVNQQFSSGASTGTAIFCLANPTSGNLSLIVTGSVHLPGEIHVMGASYTGVNQTTPCTNYASLTSPASITTVSLTVTSATGDLATAVYSNDQQPQGASNPNLNGTPLTVYGNDFSGPNISMEANFITGAATVALTDTAAGAVTDWQVSGVDIQAAGGGGGATCGARLLVHVGC